MSSEEPRRLRDDPEFLALTGLRFSDEEATASRLDVDAGRKALEAALAQGATSSLGPADFLATTTSKVSVGLAVVATVAGIGLWPGEEGGPTAQSLTPVERSESRPEAAKAPGLVSAISEEPKLAHEVEPAAAQRVEHEAPPPAPPSKPAPEEATTPKPRPSETRASKAARTPPKVPVKAKAPAPPKVKETQAVASTSTLPEQLALYERGKRALAQRDYGEAIEAFEAYRDRFPGGSLRRETGLSMLEALARSGRSAKASRVARRLLAAGGLGKRGPEVRRVLGEMQARLGQCDDAAITLATALQEGAPGLTVSAVEAAVAHCRKRDEGGP